MVVARRKIGHRWVDEARRIDRPWRKATVECDSCLWQPGKGFSFAHFVRRSGRTMQGGWERVASRLLRTLLPTALRCRGRSN
jgi:hypothetical protein